MLLTFFAQRNTPIPTGKVEDYWEFACGVEIEGFNGYFSFIRAKGILPKQGDWYFYYFKEHHGTHIFKVREKLILEKSKEVFSILEIPIIKSKQKNNRVDDLDKKNKRRSNCIKIRNSVSANSEKFIQMLNSPIRDMQNKPPNILDIFKHKWQQYNRYWILIVFEALFLPLWWLFSFHAGIFGKLNSKKSIRVAFSPLLLFVPYYLGYISHWDFYGILYPLIASIYNIAFAWIPINSFDIALFDYLPKPLTYITLFSNEYFVNDLKISMTGLLGFTCVVLFIKKISLKT
jgi:hypothetical protein